MRTQTTGLPSSIFCQSPAAVGSAACAANAVTHATAHPPAIESHSFHLESDIVVTRSVGLAFARENMAICRKRSAPTKTQTLTWYLHASLSRRAGDALKYLQFQRCAR